MNHVGLHDTWWSDQRTNEGYSHWIVGIGSNRKGNKTQIIGWNALFYQISDPYTIYDSREPRANGKYRVSAQSVVETAE